MPIKTVIIPVDYPYEQVVKLVRANKSVKLFCVVPAISRQQLFHSKAVVRLKSATKRGVPGHMLLRSIYRRVASMSEPDRSRDTPSPTVSEDNIDVGGASDSNPASSRDQAVPSVPLSMSRQESSLDGVSSMSGQQGVAPGGHPDHLPSTSWVGHTTVTRAGQTIPFDQFMEGLASRIERRLNESRPLPAIPYGYQQRTTPEHRAPNTLPCAHVAHDTSARRMSSDQHVRVPGSSQNVPRQVQNWMLPQQTANQFVESMRGHQPYRPPIYQNVPYPAFPTSAGRFNLPRDQQPRAFAPQVAAPMPKKLKLTPSIHVAVVDWEMVEGVAFKRIRLGPKLDLSAPAAFQSTPEQPGQPGQPPQQPQCHSSNPRDDPRIFQPWQDQPRADPLNVAFHQRIRSAASSMEAMFNTAEATNDRRLASLHQQHQASNNQSPHQ